jgi:rod shape-determining protein MreD
MTYPKPDWLYESEEGRPYRVFLSYAAASAILIMFVILNIIPLPIAALEGIRPPFVLIMIYYMAILRPQLVKLWLVFMLGLLLDILQGYPLGVQSLLFVMMQMIIVNQHRYFMGQSFIMTWWGFMMMVLLMTVLQWLLVSFLYWHLLPFQPLLATALCAVFFFPLVVPFLQVADKLLRKARAL